MLLVSGRFLLYCDDLGNECYAVEEGQCVENEAVPLGLDAAKNSGQLDQLKCGSVKQVLVQVMPVARNTS